MQKPTRDTSLLIALILIVAMPACGLWLFDFPLSGYFRVPPCGVAVAIEGVSWVVFCIYVLFIVITCLPFVIRLAGEVSLNKAPLQRKKFPLYGYLGLTLIASGWILAWNRFEFFQAFQIHTFVPLWFGFIITCSALLVARTGSNTVIRSWGRFLALFLVSSAFWWLFEYLNGITQNWNYLGVSHLSQLEYFFFASVSFSTVLPAVTLVQALLMTSSLISTAFVKFWPIHISRKATIAGLVVALVSLFLIPKHPNALFPMLWVAPLIILCSVQSLNGRKTILDEVVEGNWTQPVSWGLAALCCGFFWELWNFKSEAKWIYQIPYVEAFKVFEMPVLGYAGYLPFGVFCGAVSTLVLKETNT